MREQSATLNGILLAGCLAAASAFAAAPEKTAAPATPLDFAYAVPLQFEGQDALYQATLPLSVYQHTVRGDLGDLRVFNAQDEVVPHMLRLPERSSTTAPVLNKLAHFPLQGADNAGLDQLSVRIKRNSAGTLINIGSNAKHSAQTTLSGYLLDTSALKQAIVALELDWKNGKENFVGALHIEYSDDLTNWRTLIHGAPLANLQFGGHSLLQKRIEFPALQAKYLRLSWPQQQAPLLLGSVNAELAAQRIEAPLNWLPVNGDAVADKTGEYQFDLGAHLPLQRISIELPQMNTLVQAALFSRARSGDAWRPAANALLYKLHHSGQDLNNPEITVTGTHRYWLLRVEQKNGGIGTGLPKMQAGWQPHQLQFVTRGNAPFQIAYGSNEIKPAEFQMQNILPAAVQDKPELKIRSAQTGTPVLLGGAAKLSPAAPPLPWKKWVLWVVLGVAVLLLGGMAYRLIKQLEHHDSNKIQ